MGDGDKGPERGGGEEEFRKAVEARLRTAVNKRVWSCQVWRPRITQTDDKKGRKKRRKEEIDPTASSTTNLML